MARPGPAIRAARRAPHGELRTYPGVDHFDIYDGPEHELVVADEVEFLRRTLGLAVPDMEAATAITDQAAFQTQTRLTSHVCALRGWSTDKSIERNDSMIR